MRGNPHKQHHHHGFGRGRRGRSGPGLLGSADSVDDTRGMGPGGPGRGRGGFGPSGFGPGGFGPGGFGPGGPRRGGRRGGPGRRGNVRLAVLALLAEEPRHGYALMTEMTERSNGLWKPSPGSVYPVLSQLEDEGLVDVESRAGRRIYQLTVAGREFVQDHQEELSEPWRMGGDEPTNRVRDLMQAGSALAGAVHQVARVGSADQARQAIEVLTQARTSLYRILAELPADDGGRPGDLSHEPPASPRPENDGNSSDG